MEKDANLATSSGDLFLDETYCGAVAVTTSSGDVTAEELTVERVFAIATTSGDTCLAAVACDNLRVQSSSGRMDLMELVASGHIELCTSSGDIHLTHSDAETIGIETSSGSVTGSLLTDKIFYTETSSGSVSVPKSTVGGLCEISTSSGDIRITLGD